MFVDTELLVSPLVFHSKKMSLITDNPPPHPRHQMTKTTLLRFAFLTYDVICTLAQSLQQFHLLGRHTSPHFLLFQMVMIKYHCIAIFNSKSL